MTHTHMLPTGSLTQKLQSQTTGMRTLRPKSQTLMLSNQMAGWTMVPSILQTLMPPCLKTGMCVHIYV